MARMLGKTQWTHGCKWRCCMYPQHKSSSKRQEEREWRGEWLMSEDLSYDTWYARRHFECDDDYPIDFDAVLGEDCFFNLKPVRARQTIKELLYGDILYLKMIDMRERPSLMRGNILWLDPLG